MITTLTFSTGVRLNALKMFTTWAAYGGFDENKRGVIKEGYDADILFWDIKNIDEIPYWFGNSNSRITKIMKFGEILSI